MKKKLYFFLLILPFSSYSAIISIDDPQLEPIYSNTLLTSIEVRKVVVERVILEQMRKPYSLPKSPSWPKASNLASAFGAILTKLSDIYIANYVNNLCKSDVIENSEDFCYTPPKFEAGYFCISLSNNSNYSYSFDARELKLNWVLNNPDLYKRSPRVTVNSNEEVCYTNTSGNHMLVIKSNHNNVIFRRGLDDGLFSGQFGGVVKNGKFYLIKKRTVTKTNTNTIAPLCDITAGWNGEKMCRDKLINGIINPVEYEVAYNYFTKNILKASHYDNSPFSSFIVAVTYELPMYTRYGMSKGISFYRKFRVTKEDIQNFPDLFQSSDVGKVYQVVASHSKNKVHYGKLNQVELLKSKNLTVGIIRKNTNSNVWDEEDFIEDWVTL